MTLVAAAVAVAQLAAGAQAKSGMPAPQAPNAAGTARISGTVRNAADDARPRLTLQVSPPVPTPAVR
jgi:hypothetical protein